MTSKLKSGFIDLGVGLFAVSVGALVVYFGDRLLGVKLEIFYGVGTFTPLWVLDLFLVPVIAGIVVTSIYGLGGKMWAHASPLIVRVISFYDLNYVSGAPEGMAVLPLSYWLLIVIVSVEFAAIGGFLGEVFIKKIYGRTAKERWYKSSRKESGKITVPADPPDKI